MGSIGGVGGNMQAGEGWGGGWRMTDQEEEKGWVGRRQISVCATGQETDN